MKKPLRSLAVLAMAGLFFAPAAAVISAPTAASALAGTSAGSRQAHAVPMINTSCRFHSNRFTTYYDGCVHWTNYACVALHHFNISPPDYVSNDCEQAVDLYPGSNETGHPICIPGMHKSGLLHTHYHSFRITGGGTC